MTLQHKSRTAMRSNPRRSRSPASRISRRWCFQSACVDLPIVGAGLPKFASGGRRHAVDRLHHLDGAGGIVRIARFEGAGLTGRRPRRAAAPVCQSDRRPGSAENQPPPQRTVTPLRRAYLDLIDVGPPEREVLPPPGAQEVMPLTETATAALANDSVQRMPSFGASKAARRRSSRVLRGTPGSRTRDGCGSSRDELFVGELLTSLPASPCSRRAVWCGDSANASADGRRRLHHDRVVGRHYCGLVRADHPRRRRRATDRRETADVVAEPVSISTT